MILLDTNVLAALMRAPADPAVIAWLDRQPPTAIWITSITGYEVEFGLALLSPGRRRSALEAAYREILETDLQGRVAPLDQAAATQAAQLAAARQRAGRPVDIRDTQIAGIALSRRAALATRNTAHFHDLTTPVIDQWKSAA
jgi:predicted nucleic acid-binding protein